MNTESHETHIKLYLANIKKLKPLSKEVLKKLGKHIKAHIKWNKRENPV